MEKLIVKKTVEEVIGYKAEDGREFFTEKECLEYEKTAKCAIRNAFNKSAITSVNGYDFVDFIPSCDDCSDVYVYTIKSVDDVKLLNMISDYGTIGTDKIGSTVFVTHNRYEDEYWISDDTLEGYKKKFCDYIDSLCNNTVNE